MQDKKDLQIQLEDSLAGSCIRCLPKLTGCMAAREALEAVCHHSGVPLLADSPRDQCALPNLIIEASGQVA